ncbi:MAG: hypothetical protein NVSMB1_02890 [Polyangiales bacterium]
MRVLVVGGGFAGVAAAVTARAEGADVTIVTGRAGASALGCGAYDLEGWRVKGGDRASIPEEVRSFLEHAEAPIVVEDAHVVTPHGVLRPARARDLQVLPVPASRAVIVIPRVPVVGWDADAIAASLQETFALQPSSDRCAAHVVDATLLFHKNEMRMPIADVAAAHDDPARADWLVARLKEALQRAPSANVILLPPILGIAPTTVARIRTQILMPIGEALGEPGGPAALRHAHWTRVELRRAAIDRIDRDVACVSQRGARVDGVEHEADRIILAIGGAAAGGLLYGTSENEGGGETPPRAQTWLRASVTIERAETEEPVVLFHRGAPLLEASSLFGGDPSEFLLDASPALLQAGFAVDSRATVIDRRGDRVPWLFAAGDVLQATPRTALSAIERGIRAGRAAAAA